MKKRMRKKDSFPESILIIIVFQVCVCSRFEIKKPTTPHMQDAARIRGERDSRPSLTDDESAKPRGGWRRRWRRAIISTWYTDCS